jgi:hypothetical protein
VGRPATSAHRRDTCPLAHRCFARFPPPAGPVSTDLLRQCSPSLVVDVNRALAKAMDSGARVGLDELDAIPEREVLGRYPYALAAYADLHASLGNPDEARAYLDRALANQSSPAQQALLKRKRAALDETHAMTDFGSDRPCGTAELRARLEGYWTRTLESLKARLENAPEERDSD